jgi:hypothetical protein
MSGFSTIVRSSAGACGGFSGQTEHDFPRGHRDRGGPRRRFYAMVVQSRPAVQPQGAMSQTQPWRCGTVSLPSAVVNVPNDSTTSFSAFSSSLLMWVFLGCAMT